jgi:hypothetical protein
MELPDVPTANELAEFVRSNSSGSYKLSFKRRWYEGMETWTEPAIRAVSDAARHNTSIRYLSIDVAGLSSNVAASIARIISQFRHVRNMLIRDSMRRQAEVPMARPHVVDAVLYGIMASESIIEDLELYGCCSPRTFRDFIERFPSLRRLAIVGQRVHVAGNSNPAFDAFAFAVSLALSRGKFPVLESFRLDSDAGDAPFLRLLNAAQKSTTICVIFLCIANRSRGLLSDAYLFCASDFTKTVNTVVVRPPSTAREFLDISSFFPAGELDAFSPSINYVHFSRCEANNVDLLWLDRAAKALANIQNIDFNQCRIPLALELLDRLPGLRHLTCLSRLHAIESTHTLDDEEIDDTPYVLGTNEALTKFCQVIERPTSLLRAVEIDVIAADESMDFPSIASLLMHSQGELVVNFGQLPFVSSFHVVRGARCLGARLKVLRIRFCRCKFKDGNFASIIRAMGAENSLKILEFGFDTHAFLGSPELSIAALRDLILLNDTLEELAVRGLCSEALVTIFESISPTMTTTNRSLRKLDFLSAGQIDGWPRIRGPLLSALQMNGVLAQVGGNLRAPEDDHAVLHLLKQNKYGRQFLLPRDAPAPKGLWTTIFARISEDNHHEVMYAFLRSKLASLLHPSLDLEGDVGGVGVGKRRRSGRKRSRAQAQGLE